MSTTAIVTMIVILGFVWGGFLLIVSRAARAEREKKRGAASRGEPRSGPA